jgi:hypothetical protein
LIAERNLGAVLPVPAGASSRSAAARGSMEPFQAIEDPSKMGPSVHDRR